MQVLSTAMFGQIVMGKAVARVSYKLSSTATTFLIYDATKEVW